MSYSRHAVRDEDVALQHDVNYRVHMHVRRMMSENKAMRRRKGRERRQQQLNDMEENAGERNGGPKSKVRGEAKKPIIATSELDLPFIMVLFVGETEALVSPCLDWRVIPHAGSHF